MVYPQWGKRASVVGSRHSGLDLDLCVEGLSLSFQAAKLHLDEVSQSLPHFHLKGKIEIHCL